MCNKGFSINTETFAQVSMMDDADAGALFKSILRYSLDGTEPQQCSPFVQFAFQIFKAKMDRDEKRRNELSQKRREAADRRWNENPRNTEEGTEPDTDGLADEEAQPSAPAKPARRTHEEVEKEKEALQRRQEAKKEDFYQSLVPYVQIYGKEMIRSFFDYWTEPNKSGTKWRYELERTWDLKRRLGVWSSKTKVTTNEYGTDNRANSADARQKRATDAASIVARLAAEDDADQ